MENISLELILTGCILLIVLIAAIQKIVTYIMINSKNKPVLLFLLSELINNENIQNKVLEILNEIKMGDFDTYDEYLNYAKNKISKEIYDYIILNYPQYSSLVNLNNIGTIVESIISLLDKKEEETLSEKFDKDICERIETNEDGEDSEEVNE